MRRLQAVLAVVIVCVFYFYHERRSPAAVPAVEQTGAPAAAASRGSFDPATRVAVIHAKDFAFEAPDSITAGWTIFHLLNDGPSLHHVQIVRLDSSKTLADLETALKNPGPSPRWASFIGGPNAPNPGAESDATFDLATGNYALLCLVDIPGGVPHFAKGMVHGFTVLASTSTAGAAPAADETISLSDYAFGTKAALKSGPHTIKVVNNGAQPHEVELVQLAAGKTAKDLMTWLATPDGPPPGNAIGGVAAMMPGMSGYFMATLTPGKYLMLCFIPDAKDGKPHLAHGMMKEVTVE
jgi:hypothetical protein